MIIIQDSFVCFYSFVANVKIANERGQNIHLIEFVIK